MTLEQYTDQQILADVSKLQYLYKLKQVIRYNQDREEHDSTESVAEHVYGMLLLVEYFLPLEDPDEQLDRKKLFEMILFHDIDEIETGDRLGYTKTEADRAEELNAMKRVLSAAPPHMQKLMTDRVEEYEAWTAPEARFAKAIDKVEPLVQIFNEKGREILRRNHTTAEQSLRIKTPYVAEFPFIKRFNDTIHQRLIDDGYYWIE